MAEKRRRLPWCDATVVGQGLPAGLAWWRGGLRRIRKRVTREVFLVVLLRRYWMLLAGTLVLTPMPGGDFALAGEPAPGIFDLPAISVIEQDISALIQRRSFTAAFVRADSAVRAYPGFAGFHLARGVIANGIGRQDEAVESFVAAWRLGDRQLLTLLETEAFSGLRDVPQISALISEASAAPPPAADDDVEIEPAPVIRAQAMVSVANTAWDPGSRRLVSLFAFPDVLKTKPVMTGTDPVAVRLRRLVTAGKAAGHAGDLYDNRDRGHATLRRRLFPQLSWVDYAPEARAAGIEYGYNSQTIFNAVTVGNSSTAIKGKDRWRSQPRLALSSQTGAMDLARSYASNQIYLFPEHRDHDPVRDNGRGDLFHANTPYVLISQGSSKSERGLMEAVGVILAGFTPETKAFLKQTNLVGPTVQQIFRHGRIGIDGEASYLSGRAHPTVFDAASIEVGRMLDLAQAMRADAVPPMVRIDVTSETSTAVPFAEGFGEGVFDTPSAIARIHRATSIAREITVSAAETTDPNGRPLTFRWVLLRGDPARVSIAPDAVAGNTADLRIDWHDRFTTTSAPEIETSRVDIGVFAHNGVHWSAPAIVSVMFPQNQKRVYGEAGEIRSIDFAAWPKSERYVDPFLIPKRGWRDDFHYDAGGRLTGWTRHLKSGEVERFTAHGLRVLETDDRGRPAIAEILTYPVVQEQAAIPRVNVGATGKIARYTYRSETDLVGEPVLINPSEAAPQ